MDCLKVPYVDADLVSQGTEGPLDTSSIFYVPCGYLQTLRAYFDQVFGS